MAVKERLTDLAILGGAPAFAQKIHVGRPNIGDRQSLFERINDLLDRHWLTNSGPYVEDFEKKIARFVNCKHCIAICNGTVALEIVIRALELKGEVIVPSFTFIATAHALQWQEITPVFCDIDPKTYNIDVNKVEAMITPRTSGIIGVHLWGHPCNIDILESIAKKHHLKLLFDAAHAFSCSYRGRMIGTFGDAEVFSFHATKILNTFEGGAVCTNNDELAAKIRLMKNFGFSGYDNVIYIGTNGKMTEISAAMGLTGLECLDDFISINYSNYVSYEKELGEVSGVRLIRYDESERCNFHYIVLDVNEEAAGLDRDTLIEILNAENVLARRYFYPGCHRMQPYRSYFPNAGLMLPETERFCRRVLVLPNSTAVNADAIKQIVQIIRLSIDNADEIRRRIQLSV